MKGVSFPQANVNMMPPEGMDNCSSLPVWRGNLTDGQPVVISCWELSFDELATLIKTRKLWLYIHGHGMPPVAPSAFDPFPKVVEPDPKPVGG